MRLPMSLDEINDLHCHLQYFLYKCEHILIIFRIFRSINNFKVIVQSNTNSYLIQTTETKVFLWSHIRLFIHISLWNFQPHCQRYNKR